MTILTAQYLQPKGYSAKSDRQFIEATERGATGVHGYSDFLVSAGGGMTVQYAAGDALVRGTTNTLQGTYRVKNDAAVTGIVVAAADGTNPRIDSVYLKILDNTEAGGGTDAAQVVVVTGTPTGGATLDNRTGAGAAPASSILLADLNITAGLGSILAANIRDRRPLYSQLIPPLLTTVDMVPFQLPIPNHPPLSSSGTYNPNQTSGSSHDLRQAAGAFYLPRRIVSATRIRWGYMQWATTAITGNYVLAIFDASGRKIVDTGSVALVGAAGSLQERSETISATSFDAGMYYVFFGLDATNTGSLYTPGLFGFGTQIQSPFRNVLLGSTSGGLTVPSSLASFVEHWPVQAALPTVPFTALSVG